MYARGILFGKMKYELGDHSFVRCPENGLVADVEFKTKGYFSGGYNVITGTIKHDKTQEVLYELSGTWSGEMFIKDVATGHRELLFDATNAKHTPPMVRPLEVQEERESPKLWAKVTTALKERNHDLATDEKTRIEDMQRAEAAHRAEQGLDWKPRLFRPVRTGPGEPEEGDDGLDWILNANIDGRSPDAQIQQILSIVPIVHRQNMTPQPPTQGQGEPHLQTAQPPPAQGQASTAAPERGAPAEGSLIDFGHAPVGASSAEPYQQPSSYPTHAEPPFSKPDPMTDHAPGLQQPLQPSQPQARAVQLVGMHQPAPILQQPSPFQGAVEHSLEPGPPATAQTGGAAVELGGLRTARRDTLDSGLEEFMDADDGLAR
ncbi:MAG: hypothetical protein M1826_002537 [Phylliscum demangeonii]|nr:MAG: hypothetical protein M1826_002537 [Phylliscum demangeonii]